jgi:hypothetical protein
VEHDLPIVEWRFPVPGVPAHADLCTLDLNRSATRIEDPQGETVDQFAEVDPL